VASLTAGSMLFAWMAELALPEIGLRFFVAANILAAAPSYVFPDLTSIGGGVFVLLTLLVGLCVHCFFTASVRNIPTQSPTRSNPRLPRATTPLPISLDVSGLISVLFPLVALGIMRAGASIVAGSKSRPIRWLADVELQITDMRNPRFWVFLFVIAFAVKIAFDYSAFNPADIASTFRKLGTYVPGLRPGKVTADYLLHVWSRIAWAGGFATMLVLTGTALVYYGQRRTGVWPVMLGLTISTVKPILALTRYFGALGLATKYKGFGK
jgi:preprotein translocase subunit SecY